MNPNRDEIDGALSLPSVLDFLVTDLAVILVGDSVEAFEEVLDCKPAFAVTSWPEVGHEGARLQERLEALVADGADSTLGPNTNWNALETFRDDSHPEGGADHPERPPGPTHLPGPRARARASSHWAPTGNEADLEFADFTGWFADQPEIGVIAAYIEGFKDGRTLLLAVRSGVAGGYAARDGQGRANWKRAGRWP